MRLGIYLGAAAPRGWCGAVDAMPPLAYLAMIHFLRHPNASRVQVESAAGNAVVVDPYKR